MLLTYQLQTPQLQHNYKWIWLRVYLNDSNSHSLSSSSPQPVHYVLHWTVNQFDVRDSDVDCTVEIYINDPFYPTNGRFFIALYALSNVNQVYIRVRTIANTFLSPVATILPQNYHTDSTRSWFHYFILVPPQCRGEISFYVSYCLIERFGVASKNER